MLAQDDDPTHENAPPSHIVLAKEDCTIPHTSAFEVEKAAGLVHPDTLRWLEELEEKHGFRMHDDLAAAAGQAISSLENQLCIIDRYKIRFLEVWDLIIAEDAMENEARFEEKEWELEHIENFCSGTR
ncbi:unnamed protein product [Brassica rapa]|uniref:Uncharacterized protein n=1 Tax=Brassica campestris TaxID=3711 RepID=A0A3P5ZMG1_BRACM|nr:unnamed protein product [Brassica rapa]VDC77605.1 unnamed protein product [Brassica rapa]